MNAQDWQKIRNCIEELECTATEVVASLTKDFATRQEPAQMVLPLDPKLPAYNCTCEICKHARSFKKQA